MRVLVTGGAGFIGANFIYYWLNKYPRGKLINLDKLTYAGNLASLRMIKSKNYTFIKGSISDGKLVERLMKKADVVVHLAAESHVDRSIYGPQVFIKTNVVGTQALLAAAVNNKIRFHHVSTDEVFGALPLKSKLKFNEQSLYQPNSPYAASKGASDLLVRAYGQTYNLPTTITNCSNNYGPYQYPEKFIPRAITNLLEGKKVPIYGDGLYVRDWLYVEDHCRAIDLVIREGKIGETYCVGGLTRDVSNLQVVRWLCQLLKRDFRSSVEYVEDRPGHDRRYAVDWRKIKRELGWQPTVSFKEGLKKTVEWYQNNDWWWRPLKRRAERFYRK
jgi:dTDP-glucose 4,6-dehydratase